eukprot:TRINITY_DN657_c0_g2_i3.p3 TRINITY_DN657_c0_g2~~TRINITY_DN657_c0_g2_i3.p3  ORF type:complete len:222 (-),score=8.43 TRINITY_DN657_c0_g2_i3:1423-2088(-)
MLRSLILLVLVAATLQDCLYSGTCCCQPLPNKAYLLSASEWSLFWLGLNKKLGACKVIDHRHISGSHCDFYVNSDYYGTSSGSGTATAAKDALTRGYPLATDGRGTGCVVAPDFPKGISTCWYDSFNGPHYGKAINQISSIFCTNQGIRNGAAQLRHAIQNDACNCDPQAQIPPVAVAFWSDRDVENDPGYYTQAEFVAGTGSGSGSGLASGSLFGFGNRP